MFGVLVSGRLVQTAAQQVSPTKMVFALDNATDVQTLVVFLTGQAPLPPGACAVVWLGWPPFNSWKYLGYLTNERPSAVYKVTQARDVQEGMATAFGQFQYNANTVAQVGIELAELHATEHQYGAYQTKQAVVASQHQTFGQRMLENLFNYIGSFTVEITNNFTGVAERIIPLSLFEKWYASTQSKLQNNPNFLRDAPS